MIKIKNNKNNKKVKILLEIGINVHQVHINI